MSEDNYSAKEENDMSQNEIRKQRLFSNFNSFRYPGGYLSIDKYKFSLNHYYESNRSAARSSVGFIVSGRVELRSRYVSLKLSAEKCSIFRRMKSILLSGPVRRT